MSRLVAAPPPNRVRSPTDRQFASGCSPRRFEPTQLPLASELWHTPARTFTVLMWRPHRRTHPARRARAELRCNEALPQIGRLHHMHVTVEYLESILSHRASPSFLDHRIRQRSSLIQSAVSIANTHCLSCGHSKLR